MVGLLWSPLDWLNLYANYSTAFETPTFNELGNLSARGIVGGFAPGITAQGAQNFEIGAKGRFGYELVPFHIAVGDEVVNLASFGGSTGSFTNADTTREGLEAAVTVSATTTPADCT
ncbi:MAG: TonB-dependent receptor [Gammaproteobacteria bacterium]